MEFDGLRLILLLIGILIVIGVYFWDRTGKNSRDQEKVRKEPALDSNISPAAPSEISERREPVIASDVGATQTDAVHHEPVVHVSEEETEVTEVPILYDEIFKTPEPGEPSDVIVLNVFSQSGQRFAGVHLGEALHASGMEYGAMRIYHRMDDTGDRLFSLANSVEPGYFEPDRFTEFSTPGVSMFLALPGPSRPAAALEELIATAESLTRHLDGRLLDQGRNPLHTQGIEHLRERVREFERQQRLAAART